MDEIRNKMNEETKAAKNGIKSATNRRYPLFKLNSQEL